MDEFTEWLGDVGFAWRRIDEDRGTVDEELGITEAIVSVQVPLGAAPDARELISGRPGVETADLNYLMSVQ